MKEIHLTNLPWPVSLNATYGVANSKMFMKPKAAKYKRDLCLLCKLEAKKKGWETLEGGVGICFAFFPPDNRRHDLDNLLKLVKDAFQDAGLYADDNNIVKSFQEKILPLKKHDGFFNATIYECEKKMV